MIVHEMKSFQILSPELTRKQTKHLNESIVRARATSVINSKKIAKGSLLDRDFKCNEFIAIVGGRYFEYKVKLKFKIVSEEINGLVFSIADRVILSESTTEYSLDDWLDKINKRE